MHALSLPSSTNPELPGTDRWRRFWLCAPSALIQQGVPWSLHPLIERHAVTPPIGPRCHFRSRRRMESKSTKLEAYERTESLGAASERENPAVRGDHRAYHRPQNPTCLAWARSRHYIRQLGGRISRSDTASSTDSHGRTSEEKRVGGSKVQFLLASIFFSSILHDSGLTARPRFPVCNMRRTANLRKETSDV